MKELFSYIKPYWKAAALAPLLMSLEVICDLLQPALMARIVDRGVISGNNSFILQTGGLMIAVGFLGLTGGVGCTIFSSIASQKFAADLRNSLFKKVESFSFMNLDRLQTASLITRLTNDVTQVQNIVLAMLRMMVRAPLLCIGGIVMSFIINPGLASILIFTIPFLAAVLTLIIRKSFPMFAKVQQRLDRVNTVLRENLAGVRVIKAFVRSEYEISRFGTANNDLTEISVRAGRVVGLTMPAMFALMNLSVVAVVWFGGLRVNAGNIQVGQVMAFINYMTQILFSLMMVAFMTMGFSRAKASADRIREVLETKADITDPPRPNHRRVQTGRIEFDNVSFRYENSGGAPALQQINLVAAPGEMVAILGATGSGKSTLVNLIPRFYDVTAGQILIDGFDARSYRLDDLRRGISMVFQESLLFSGTIAENIRWGRPDASNAAVEAAAALAQAHDFIAELPAGYNTFLGQRGVNLSGGQKQRLAIARALLRQTPILILDDATSALDLGTEARLRASLEKLKSTTTCFLIAQRISSALNADQIILLDDGKIVGNGTHRQLLAGCPLYREIYDSQLGREAEK